MRAERDHCGKLDLPASCLSSTSTNDAGADGSAPMSAMSTMSATFSDPAPGVLKPLAVFGCGG